MKKLNEQTVRVVYKIMNVKYENCEECGNYFQQTFTSDGVSMNYKNCEECDYPELIGEWE